jgi:ADP-ribose pyrophosphatase
LIDRNDLLAADVILLPMKQIVPLEASLIPDNAICAFKGEIFDVYQWQQELFDGSTATFEKLRRPDTVEVICLVEDKIIVVKDEQPSRPAKLSFPGGRVNRNEDIGAAAKREVIEETGYEFKQWRLVKVWQPYVKITWFIYVFIAWDGKKTMTQHLDAGEKITVDLVEFDLLKQMAADKLGYLGESETLLRTAGSIQGLRSAHEFSGKALEVVQKY